MKEIQGYQMIGTQRSGSNLLRLMLNQLPQVAAPHPPHILKTFVPLLAAYDAAGDWDPLVEDVCEWVDRNPAPWSASPLDRAAVKARLKSKNVYALMAAVYEVAALRESAEAWLNKSLGNVHHAEAMMQEAGIPHRFIWIYRDGRDVACSFRRTLVGPKHAYHIAQRWQRDQAACQSLYEGLGPDQVFPIRYEALIADPEGELRRLCSWIGWPYTNEMLDFHQSDESQKTASAGRMWANLVKPVMADNHHKFEAEFSAADHDIFVRVAGPMLKKLGYVDTLGGDAAFAEADLSAFAREEEVLRQAALAQADPEDLRRRRRQQEVLARFSKTLSL